MTATPEPPPAPPEARRARLEAALRSYGSSSEAEAAAAEAAAWRRLSGRLGRRARLPWGLAAAGAGALAVAAVLLLGRTVDLSRGADSAPIRTAIEAPAAPARPVLPPPGPPALHGTTSRAPAEASGVTIALGAIAQALSPGETRIVNHGRVAVSAGARVDARTNAGRAEVRIIDGTIDLDDGGAGARRGAGHWRVLAGPYVFVDVGTRFRVACRGSSLELTVAEGAVEVWRGPKRLGTVTARAGFWTATVASARPTTAVAPASLEPPRAVARAAPASSAPAVGVAAPASSAPAVAVGTPASSAPSRPVAAPAVAPVIASPPSAPGQSTSASAPPPCAAVARAGDVRGALACFEIQATGQGLGAETALYEMARLRRDELADLPGALAALESARRRFPDSALRLEVALSIIDLLPRLGRYADALAESERLLATHADLERADDLRLLRGNVYREALDDCTRAVAEYAAVRAAAGATADTAAFETAACLERLGRRAEARQAYADYLARMRPAHAAEARRHLDALSR